MSEADGRRPSSKEQRDAARAERLAAELRANLRRRKDQARARREPGPLPGAGGDDETPPRECS